MFSKLIELDQFVVVVLRRTITDTTCAKLRVVTETEPFVNRKSIPIKCFRRSKLSGLFTENVISVIYITYQGILVHATYKSIQSLNVKGLVQRTIVAILKVQVGLNF